MLITVGLLGTYAHAAFEHPLQRLLGREGIAILKDGTRLEGNPTMIPKGTGGIKKLTMELPDGTKRTLTPGELTSFAFKPTDNAAPGHDYAYYVPVLLPSGKPLLVQQLNRGFDGTLQVFADPEGRETAGMGIAGVQIRGGMPTSYLVTKHGGEASFLVTKRRYDKLWPAIYGDCPAMEKPDKTSFKDMADHVRVHASKCADGPLVADPAPGPPGSGSTRRSQQCVPR